MPEPDRRPPRVGDRNRLIAYAAYGALALIVVVGVVRARRTQALQAERAAAAWERPVFAGPAAPEPLSPTPWFRRHVRWCEVREVLAKKCQRCHAAPPLNGAPISLMSYADTQRDYPPGSGHPVYSRMHELVRQRRMPPVGQVLDPPVEPLDEQEKDVLLVWLEEGAWAFGGEERCTHDGAPLQGAAGGVEGGGERPAADERR